ncbi:hypothetical protein BDQ17DRAFT_1330821 [Cyathus striatus]|nr:hypothetical protein BDQ17DRAFT_1330821 [Cyathus striatus]
MGRDISDNRELEKPSYSYNKSVAHSNSNRGSSSTTSIPCPTYFLHKMAAVSHSHRITARTSELSISDFENTRADTIICTSIPSSIQNNAKTQTTELYEIHKSSEGCGLGMFAKRMFEVGDLIVAERPLMIAPLDIDSFGGMLPAKCSMLCKLEACLNVAFNRMNEENQKAFLALHKSPSAYNMKPEPLINIWRVNSYEIDFLEKLTHIRDAKPRFSGVFKNMSRINHSCRPNCSTPIFNPASFSHQIRATRRIAPGDEILRSYVNALDEPLAEKRQKEFSKYGFTCSCGSCISSDSESPNESSGTILMDLSSKYTELLNILTTLLKSDVNYECARYIYDTCTEMMRKMESQDLDGLVQYLQVMELCIGACEALSELEEGVDGKEKFEMEGTGLKERAINYALAHDGYFK